MALKFKRVITAIAAASLLMVSATACSQQTQSGTEGKIDSNKVYKIATDTAFKPFAFANDKNEMVGIDIDLFKAIAEDQNIKYEFQALGFEGTCAALETNQVDGAMCCLNIKEERKLKYDFSDPYYTSSVVVVVKENSGYNEFSDLKGKKIGAKIATDGEKYANDLAKEYGSEAVGVEDFVSSMMMLDSGNLDGIVEDISVVKLALSEKKGYKIIGEPGYSADVGFAVPKGKDQELLSAFNEGLKNIKKNGKYDEIINNYIGTSE